MIETNFKHTEIGLIPHDWGMKSLGEIGYLQNGYAYNSHTFGDIGYTVIRISDIKNGNVVLSDAIKSIVKAPDSFLVKKGNFLIAMSGATTGKVGLYAYEKSAYINQRVGNVICMDADSGYVRYSFNSVCFSEYLTSIITAGAQPNISKKQIEEFAFPLPPTLAEQERIAGALSSIDTLIGALNEQIEKKRHIKQGTMQQLLTGKKRLAGFTGEWIEKSIDELGDLTGAGVDKTSKEDEIPVRLVNYLDVFHRDTIYNRELNFWVTANETKLQQCNVKCGDVFFTPSSEMPYDIALSAVAMEDMRNVCYSYHIYRLRFKENIDLNYRAYMFNAASFYEQANTTCEGSGKRYVISLTKFKKLRVYYPADIAEQSAIAAVLSGMDTEIAALEQKRDKYIAIKQGMMQQLLTGRIRLLEEETQEKPIVQTIQPLQKQRTANVFFRRSVLAAEIADRLCEKRRFGHVKMEKLIFMTEKMCGIDLASHYHRDAAGPYDNRALRSIDSQLKKQKWFEAKSITDENGNRRYTYMPLANRGGHKQYFDLYYADVLPEFDNVINTMADWDTEHCEIIATLYSAWEDLLHSGNAFTDDDILNELYHRWHDSKKRFSAPRLLSALTWMRQNNFIPKK